jgi:UDP-N-acetylglucosamine acyltransferase
MADIHSTAIVHPEAVLGEGVVIGPYAIVGQYVRLGKNTEVMAHAIVEGRTTIGENNKIYPSASIGLICQDLKYKGEPTKLVIGDNNHIREFSTIHLSGTLDEDTVVGSNNLIMAYAHIAHNCQIGSHIILANAVNLAGHVHIHDYVTIGGMTAIHQFVKIGAYAFVGGCSGIKKDVPPYTRGQGSGRYKVAGLNSVGLARKGFSVEQIEAIMEIYKIFYHSKRNVSQAIEYIDNLPGLTEEQRIFYEFCKNSTRGIERNLGGE